MVPCGSSMDLKWTPAAGLTPWSPSTYWSPWKLKFHSDHFSPLLKQPSVTPYCPQDRAQGIWHPKKVPQRHLPFSPMKESGSLNTCFIFWSFCHFSHCSLGTGRPCLIFTWQNPTLHIRPSSAESGHSFFCIPMPLGELPLNPSPSLKCSLQPSRDTCSSLKFPRSSLCPCTLPLAPSPFLCLQMPLARVTFRVMP